MDDLSSRLLAAIEETERRATRSADKDEWDESPHDRLRLVINDRYPHSLYDDDEYPRGPLLDVLRLGDPSSVLRRCAADRELIELCTQVQTLGSQPAATLARLVMMNRVQAYGLTDHQEGEE